MLISAACIVCFEPKTVENRPRNVAPLVKDCAVRGAVVGMRNGDVKVQEVLNVLCVVALGGDPL